MKKLKLQMQMTIDGLVAGPNGELDWMVWDWDDELKKYGEELTAPVDCIVMGRKMTPDFISHWTKVAADSKNPEFEFGKKMIDTKKVVFTKTLVKSEWKNTDLAKGDLTDEINKLKNAKGGDIVAYGGATFVSSLIKANLIDEYHLFINPIAIGNGMTIFRDLDNKQKFTLVDSKSYECGIVVIVYKPQKG